MEFLIIWVAFSALVWVMADRLGRSGGGWFFLSLFISPLLAVIFLAIAGDADGATCPECAEKVKVEAKVCKHCGHRLMNASAEAENAAAKAKRQAAFNEKYTKGRPKTPKEERFFNLYVAATGRSDSRLTDSMHRTYEKIRNDESVPVPVLDNAIKLLS